MKKAIVFVLLLVYIPAFAAEVKVLFADSMTSESSEIQPYNDWFLGSDSRKTTMAAMYEEGWKLIHVIKLSAVAEHKQFWLIFERNSE
jgi:hypothetical protein